MNPETPGQPEKAPRCSKKERKRTWNEKKRRVNFYDEQLSLQNFIKAVTANDIAMVEAYLEHGQNPNEHTGNYITALHIAAMSGFETLVQILLAHPDTDINRVDYLGRTALSRACRYGYLEIVELLLRNNANCNIVDNTGFTPLHHTALWGWHDIMNVLLRCHADPNIANAFGKTPLHIACVDNARMDMVRSLCESGADINMESALDMPVLLTCCQNCFDYDGLNMIDLLIYYGADVNVVYSPNGQTALHITAINGFVPLAEILCTAGANPNVMDKQFRTPYDVAVQMENDEMVRFLQVFFHEEVVPIAPLQSRTAAALKERTKTKQQQRRRHYESF